MSNNKDTECAPAAKMRVRKMMEEGQPCKDSVVYYGCRNVAAFAQEISQKQVLPTLAFICEDPGRNKSYYAQGLKTALSAIDVLKRLELIEERREPYHKFGDLYPTEFGKSLYTGMWYAAGKGELVPRMQAADILVPFIFWSDTVYRLETTDSMRYYMLIDLDNKMPRMMIHDVFLDPDGDMWFTSADGTNRYKLDIEAELDTEDEETQRCLGYIIDDSKRLNAEKANEGYDYLMGYTRPGEE